MPAWPLGGDRYRLAASPCFAPGAAKGDVIELDPAEHWGYRTIERSGLVAVRVFVAGLDAALRERVATIAVQAGGELDGGMNSADGPALLILNFPIERGFAAIEAAIDAIGREAPVDSWEYGNVYDNDDGVTPLVWWRQWP